MAKKRDVLGPFPPEVKALGRPTSSHPTQAWLAFIDRNIDMDRVRPLVPAVLFLFTAPFLLALYFRGGWRADDPVWIFPAGAAGCAALGVGCAIYAWRQFLTPKAQGVGRPEYLFYDDALVVKAGDAFDVVRWADVRELYYPAATKGKFRLVRADGRTFDINQWVDDEGTLIQGMVGRVKDAQLPGALTAFGKGKTVEFGELGVSREGLTYKGKVLDWAEVKSMVLRVGRGPRHLHVRRTGSMFAWCSVDINTLPNNDTLYHLLGKVAPPHLLKREGKA